MSETPAVGAPTCYRHPDRETYIRCQRCGRPICPDCMREASVGFQCPECIAEGRRTVRAPRRAFSIGRAGAIPVTWTLIGLNVLVFVAIQINQSSRLLYGLMQHTWSICVLRGGDRIGPALHQEVCSKFGGGFVPGIADGGYWELLTSVFTHQQIWHIATNMFSLYVVGSQLEPGLGKARYLALYLLSGLSGSVMVYWVADPGTPTLGASGAIFGLLGAILIFFLKARQPLQQVLFLLVLNFAITFTVPGISWGAHVGGFLGGAAVGGVLAYTGGVRRRRLQLAGLVGVGVAIVIALVARTAVLG